MKFRGLSFSASALLALALVLCACTRVRGNIEASHSPTPLAPHLFLSRAQLTPESSTSTSELSRDLNFTYFDMRVGNTRIARIHSLEALEAVEDLSAKIAYASAYVSALEFQFWKPTTDTLAQRENLMAGSLAEVFHQARSWISSESLENLRALGSSLHFINLAQRGALTALPGTPELSLNEVIEKGLTSKDRIDSGKLAPESLDRLERLVVENESLSVFLLRLRQNALKSLGFTLALGPSTRLRAPSALPFFEKSDPLERILAPDLGSRTPAELDYISGIFEWAKKTRSVLISLGYDPGDEESLDRFLARMDFSTSIEREKNPIKSRSIERLRAALL